MIIDFNILDLKHYKFNDDKCKKILFAMKKSNCYKVYIDSIFNYKKYSKFNLYFLITNYYRYL